MGAGPAGRRRPRGPRGGRGSAGDAVAVVVEDSGPGFDPAATERLFEPFYTTKPDGLGMRLAISRTIAEAHGGALTAENGPGGGAVFTLVLPVAGVVRSAQP